MMCYYLDFCFGICTIVAGIGLPMRTQNLHTCNEILEERTDFWCCGISATLVLLIVKGKKEITTKLLHELHDQLTACAIPHIPIMACDTTGCACHDQDVWDGTCCQPIMVHMQGLCCFVIISFFFFLICNEKNQKAAAITRSQNPLFISSSSV
jgi:tellurite resistance protein TehA-like permease